jgi:protein-disulfide isomerase
MHRLTPILISILSVTAITCSDDYPVTQCKRTGIVLADTDSVPLKGHSDVPVPITLFVDFQCPYTKILWEKLSLYIQEPTNKEKAAKMSILFRHLPLPSIHNRSLAAAKAGAAAYLQGNDKFWKIFPNLLTTGNKLTDEHINYYAYLAGLDQNQFNTDLQSTETTSSINRDLAIAKKLKINGTPALFICSEQASGTADEIIKNIDYILKLQDKNI